MKTITIGGKEIPMLRNALSPIIYRRIFHKDSIAPMSKITSEDMGGDVVDLYTEIAFVMAIQASKQPEELKKVTEEDFFLWLSQFDDPYAITRALEEIVNYYNEQDLTTSSAKKEEG